MDKILLVMGASSDVGIALVRKVYTEYDIIFLQYRTMNSSLSELIEDIGTRVELKLLQADLSDDTSMLEMIEQIKSSECIPNQVVHLPAPKAYNKQFHKDEWDNFNAGWEVSVRSAVELLKVCLPAMTKQKYGRVVFMLTSYTLDVPPKYQASYVTVKYALLGLMKSLAVEYADKGITVNGVSPDMMETKFLSDLPDMIVQQNAEKSPLKRNIKIDEVIPVIEYLLSDAGAAMTGQNIGITGGL